MKQSRKAAAVAKAAAFALLSPLLIFLASCSHAPVEARPGMSYTGIATWYGPGFQGNRTASGEVYDMDGMTAAHKTFPFGTKLRVTNPKDGRSVVVVVNDRGPFVAGREIDLSRGASRAIGVSYGEVIIEVLGRDDRYVKTVKTGSTSGRGSYRVQVGAFVDPWNAEHLKEGLDLGYDNVRITQATVNGRQFNRVQVGAYAIRDDAYRAAALLANEGYDTLVVRE
jgi:rare lipoprotein A